MLLLGGALGGDDLVDLTFAAGAVGEGMAGEVEGFGVGLAGRVGGYAKAGPVGEELAIGAVEVVEVGLDDFGACVVGRCGRYFVGEGCIEGREGLDGIAVGLELVDTQEGMLRVESLDVADSGSEGLTDELGGFVGD